MGLTLPAGQVLNTIDKSLLFLQWWVHFVWLKVVILEFKAPSCVSPSMIFRLPTARIKFAPTVTEKQAWRTKMKYCHIWDFIRVLMWHVGFNGDITSWIHIVDMNMRISKTFDVLWSIPAKRLKCVFSKSIFVFGKNSLVSTGKPKMEDKNLCHGIFLLRISVAPSTRYCWWFRNPYHQLRLIVYPHYLQGFSTIIPGWNRCLGFLVAINRYVTNRGNNQTKKTSQSRGLGDAESGLSDEARGVGVFVDGDGLWYPWEAGLLATVITATTAIIITYYYYYYYSYYYLLFLLYWLYYYSYSYYSSYYYHYYC